MGLSLRGPIARWEGSWAQRIKEPRVVTINRKREGDSIYEAGFHGSKIIVHAVTIHAAKQKALEHFAPKKKERNLIWVELIIKG